MKIRYITHRDTGTHWMSETSNLLNLNPLYHLQLPTFNHDVFLCFGAVVPDGYGVCYCPQDHRTVFVVSSFGSCPETDSQMFGAKLMESMREMQAVLVKAKGLSAKL